jgi:hypothetical protein
MEAHWVSTLLEDFDGMSRIPVLLLVANELDQRIRDLRADAVMFLPFNPHEFVDVIEKLAR